jgi:proline iminopeptidase
MRIGVNGTQLWFDVEGSSLVADGGTLRARPTVVLVHGGPGSFDSSYFRPEFSRLAEHAQVVYLDLRGHGRSSWSDPADWNFEACADDIRGFCDGLDVERPVVVGHSMGGPIVLLYGARHPGHAAGIVVSSGFARWNHDRLVEGFRRTAGGDVAEIADRDYRGDEVTETEAARVFAAFGPHVLSDDQLARRRQNAALNEPGMALIRGLDIIDDLAAVESPVFVSVGDLDPVTPVTASEEIVAALPAAIGRLHVVEGAGHFAWLDAPDSFWPAIFDFVDSCGRQSRAE